ncbi:MAG: hypothetical protein OXR68_00245 [Alphaproteobacteria bacterium]|nr:hypothetical protein [Alphaproteobacteria bacterium]MDD9919041.1 hypothetical protein [Alphaproteobacteria bacterium]
MNNSKRRYITYSQTIEAGGERTVPVNSNYVRCFSASAAFAIALDNEPKADMQEGIGFGVDEPFQKVRIINLSQSTALSVDMAFGRGEVADSRFTLNGALPVTGGASHNSPAQKTVGVTAASVLAINTSRTAVTFQNNSSGGQVIWIGDSSASNSGVGIQLFPGDVFVTNSQGEFYAAASVAGGKLNILEEEV